MTSRGAVLSFAHETPWSVERPRTFEGEAAPPHVTPEQVDELLGEVLERVAEAVATEREALRTALQDGRLSTDELRLALRRCRGRLDELLEL
ncbi:MAG: hypothetical protein IT372_02215 [Polyangiaceae bacterium]|nr:hypothetical protein [Polyangiaceae bacterium]